MGLYPQRERQHLRRTWHPAQIAFASTTWAADRPDNEIGKNRSRSADRQAASERPVLPATSSPVNQRPVRDMATVSAYR
jgi:hypothetical protein